MMFFAEPLQVVQVCAVTVKPAACSFCCRYVVVAVCPAVPVARLPPLLLAKVCSFTLGRRDSVRKRLQAWVGRQCFDATIAKRLQVCRQTIPVRNRLGEFGLQCCKLPLELGRLGFTCSASRLKVSFDLRYRRGQFANAASR